MALFGFGKQKENKDKNSCCGGNCTPEIIQQAEQENHFTGASCIIQI